MDLNAIREHLLDIGGVGRGEDGAVNRLLFTPEYDQAAEKLMEYMRRSGLVVRQDSVGNLHGVLPATEGGTGTLYLGSHLDTVRDGGLYDGALGIIAGVECARRFAQEQPQRAFDLHVLATNGEEGNDLGGTFGSRCMMGLLDLDQPGYLDIAARSDSAAGIWKLPDWIPRTRLAIWNCILSRARRWTRQGKTLALSPASWACAAGRFPYWGRPTTPERP